MNRYFPPISIFLITLMTMTHLHADPLNNHPNARQLERAFTADAPASYQDTGLTRADYLKLIAGNVDFFKGLQNETGAIIDPVSHGERQYSTPAFAAAAGLLVTETGRDDLLEPAVRAMNCALTALVENRAADRHPDFYIPLLVHAYRVLKDVAPESDVRAWEAQFKRIVPQDIYRMDLRGMNWNVVSSSGELLRRKDGLVSEDQRQAQFQYLEERLAHHLTEFTSLGLYHDPGAPMAYDAFTRLWLEDVLADEAYDGEHAEALLSHLRSGGLTTLLLLSPTGEWACGGRSSLHNWNDLQVTAICEINAAYWNQQGRADIAGAFKRAAHLSYQSAARWQRPSGELWIIKNRAEPEQRLAYEGYSHHTQYNLLPMAMLVIAYTRADESIAEHPTPAEVGGYLLDARETFHKVAAAAGGYYVLIDTAADPHYNATGLQRVHRAGVGYPALSDSAAAERAYGPKDAPKPAIAPGIQWRTGDGAWLGLADFAGRKDGLRVQSVKIDTRKSTPDHVDFSLLYELAGAPDGPGRVIERYRISADGVKLGSTAHAKATGYRACLPVLVSDGAADLDVAPSNGKLSVTHTGSTTTVAFDTDAGTQTPKLIGPRVVNHSGYVRQAVANAKSNSVVLTFTLDEHSE